jgi:hypothetical protein
MREALVKGNDAGEEKSRPRSQTSARIKSAGARKMLRLGWIIPLSSPKNQMKSVMGESLYRKEHLPCVLSDGIKRMTCPSNKS